MKTKNLTVLDLVWRVESLAVLRARSLDRMDRARTKEELHYWFGVAERAAHWVGRTEVEIVNAMWRRRVDEALAA